MAGLALPAQVVYVPQIPPPPPLSLLHIDRMAVGPLWRTWVRRLRNYFKLVDTPEEKKKLLLMHLADDDLFSIAHRLDREDLTFDELLLVLSERVAPTKYEERFLFRETRQGPTETMDQFHSRLEDLAEGCDFENPGENIQMQLEQGCFSPTFLRKLVGDPDKPLKEVLSSVRILELVERRCAALEARSQEQALPNEVNCEAPKSEGKGEDKDLCQPVASGRRMQENDQPPQQHLRESPTQREMRRQPSTCNNCGEGHPRTAPCPARGVQCGKCGKWNHYAKVCLTSRRQQALYGPGYDAEWSPPPPYGLDEYDYPEDTYYYY